MIRHIAMQARFALSAALCLSMLAGGVRGQTWTGTVSGSWNIAGNWSPSRAGQHREHPTDLRRDRQRRHDQRHPRHTQHLQPEPDDFYGQRPGVFAQGRYAQFSHGANPAMIAMNSPTVTIANAVSLNNSLTVPGPGWASHAEWRDRRLYDRPDRYLGRHPGPDRRQYLHRRDDHHRWRRRLASRPSPTAERGQSTGGLVEYREQSESGVGWYRPAT